MITLYRLSGYDSPRASSFAGRSVDDKPLEIDTSKIYKYDETNNEWVAQS